MNPTAAWAQVRHHVETISREQLKYFRTERLRNECLTKWCTVQTLSPYGLRVFELAVRGWWRK